MVMLVMVATMVIMVMVVVQVVESSPDPRVTLLTYLREVMGLPGTKLGCGEGGEEGHAHGHVHGFMIVRLWSLYCDGQ